MRNNSIALTFLVSAAIALTSIPSNSDAFSFNFGGDAGGGQRQQRGRRQQRQQVAIPDEPEADLYGDLGVDEDASDKEIKKAYRKLSLKYHPDHSKGDPESANMFMKISDAYGVLGNEEKKFLYDMGGMDAVAQAGIGGQQEETGGFFGGLFGGGQRQGNRGQNSHMGLTVSLADLYTGGERTFEVDRRVVCRGCKGAKGNSKAKCKSCGRCPNETRMVQRQVGPGFMVQQQEEVASEERCKNEKKALKVAIERGSPDGHQTKFPFASEQTPGQIPGDIIIVLQVTPHDSFERRGNHLHTTISITLKQALVGFKNHVLHLDGHEVVLDRTGKVTKPFETVVVQGEGMPVHEVPSEFGDLHVTIEVVFPKTLSSEQLKAINNIL